MSDGWWLQPEVWAAALVALYVLSVLRNWGGRKGKKKW